MWPQQLPRRDLRSRLGRCCVCRQSVIFFSPRVCCPKMFAFRTKCHKVAHVVWRATSVVYYQCSRKQPDHRRTSIVLPPSSFVTHSWLTSHGCFAPRAWHPCHGIVTRDKIMSRGGLGRGRPSGILLHSSQGGDFPPDNFVEDKCRRYDLWKMRVPGAARSSGRDDDGRLEPFRWFGWPVVETPARMAHSDNPCAGALAASW